MKKIKSYLKLLFRYYFKKQHYSCEDCKDTGEIWAGLSGCNIYKCECKEK